MSSEGRIYNLMYCMVLNLFNNTKHLPYMIRVKRNRVKLTRAQCTKIDELRTVQRYVYNWAVE